jgi:hypothetical protein
LIIVIIPQAPAFETSAKHAFLTNVFLSRFPNIIIYLMPGSYLMFFCFKVYVYCAQRPAGSRSAGFTCSYLCLPLSLIGLVNATIRKPPALLG